MECGMVGWLALGSCVEVRSVERASPVRGGSLACIKQETAHAGETQNA